MSLAGTLVLAQEAASGPEGIGSVFELATKGGVMMIPIALCSLAVVAVVAERLAVLRSTRIVPPSLGKRVDSAMASGGKSEAAAVCRKDGSPASRVLGAGIRKLGHSPDVIEKHIAAAGEDEVYAMRRRLRALSVVAAIAPLLGLTGTIFGMIRAFATVASSQDSLGDAELLSKGIYEAMITTAAGLLVAIPTLVAYHWLSGRVERLTRELDRLAVAFVEHHVLEPGSAEVEAAHEHVVTEPARDEPGGSPAAVGVTA
ncbi:MAG: MotA/TolQ/ExbB proton channel family protein [Planctomycetota bacterium]